MFLIAALLTGCSSSGSDAGGDSPDAAPGDSPDAGRDGGHADASPPEQDAGADASPQSPADASTSSDGGDTTDCEYTLWMNYVSDCGGAPTYVREIAAFSESGGTDEDCPRFFLVGADPTHYATLEEAIASASCDAECVRWPATSVSFEHCGFRDGYITFEDPEEDCDEIYETTDGLLTSIEEYMNRPCPGT